MKTQLHVSLSLPHAHAHDACALLQNAKLRLIQCPPLSYPDCPLYLSCTNLILYALHSRELSYFLHCNPRASYSQSHWSDVHYFITANSTTRCLIFYHTFHDTLAMSCRLHLVRCVTAHNMYLLSSQLFLSFDTAWIRSLHITMTIIVCVLHYL